MAALLEPMATTPTAVDSGGVGSEEFPTLQNQTAFAGDQEKAKQHPQTRLLNRTVARSELLGWFTTACLIINRTIATGVFTQPYNVMVGLGNPGAALFTWVIAGILSLCIAACWTELGLSIPRHFVHGHQVSTPKSGGDKNYVRITAPVTGIFLSAIKIAADFTYRQLEFIFRRPDLLMTCIFGIEFLVFGNLAGNAIQFGVYMQSVVDPRCQDDCVRQGPVVGWALGVLTLCALINITTRKFSIRLNNTFAVMKVAVVFLMIWIGIGYGSQHGDGCKKITWQNKGEGGQFGDVILALSYATYPYTGYEQPFYVLAEIRQPKSRFPKSVMYTMFSLIVLYTLINTSYLCMNPYEGRLAENKAYSTNAAINFFHKLASDSPGVREEDAVRGVSFMIAVFIFGNLLTQTYTASRVKQEIAKEGILPRSLLFAASNDTLFARWGKSLAGSDREQAPFAATLLHWAFEVLLVLSVGLSVKPTKAYNVLTYIYTFVITGILGFLTVFGLLCLKVDAWLSEAEKRRPKPKRAGRGWKDQSEWTPWLDPLPCVFAVAILAILLTGAFAPPSNKSINDLAWWVLPLVGWCSLFAGVLWWLGLEIRQRLGKYRIRRWRTTYVEAIEDEDPVQTAELVVVERRYESQNLPVDDAMFGV